MPTPTEPGLYFWRVWVVSERPCPWDARRILPDGTPGRAPISMSDDPGVIREDWGPRIPDPKRLEAMEAVVRREPRHQSGTSVICEFCNALGDTLSRPIEHAPDCPWLRAQPQESQG